MTKQTLRNIVPPSQCDEVQKLLRAAPASGLINIVKFAPEHLRAARGLLNWSRKDLKAKSGVSMETIKNIEMGVWRPNEINYLKLIETFARCGVDFVWLNGRADQGVKIGGVLRTVVSDIKTEICDKLAAELKSDDLDRDDKRDVDHVAQKARR